MTSAEQFELLPATPLWKRADARIVPFRGVCVLRLLLHLFHQAQMCISMRVPVGCMPLFVCLIPIMLVTSVLEGKARKKKEVDVI